MHRVVPAVAFPTLILVASLSAQGQDDRGTRRVKDPALQRKINAAIFSGIDHLKSAQASDGSWRYEREGRGGFASGGSDDYHGGLTALALYALAASGVPKTDAVIVKGLDWCKKHPRPFAEGSHATYCASLLVLALTRIDATEHKKWIHRVADRIADSQLKNGMWNYRLRGRYASTRDQDRGRGRRGPGGGRGGFLQTGDNSNSQFAVLALWAAHVMTKKRVSHKVWKNIQGLYMRTQLKDGSWSYKEPTTTASTRDRPGRGGRGGAVPTRMFEAKPSMTAAGLVSYTYASAARKGGVKGLDRARKTKTAKRGVAAFLADDDNWSAMFRDYYYVYSVERVGTVLGLPEDTWYPIGAEILVERQWKDGRWSREDELARGGRQGRRGPRGRPGHGDRQQAYETALALLFLSKATSYPITPRK